MAHHNPPVSRRPTACFSTVTPPSAKARFCGAKRKTKAQKETTSPLWYETLEFHEMLPADLNYAPDVILQVGLGPPRH